jgi:hypothetical protein
MKIYSRYLRARMGLGWSWLHINPPAATLTALSLSLLRGFSGRWHTMGTHSLPPYIVRSKEETSLSACLAFIRFARLIENPFIIRIVCYYSDFRPLFLSNRN